MEAWCGKRQRPLSRDKGIRQGLGDLAQSLHEHAASTPSRAFVPTPCGLHRCHAGRESVNSTKTRSGSWPPGSTGLEED